MTVTRRLRFEILRRDGHACAYCGAKAPDVPLTVDHVIPVALGGSDDPTNLVTACQDCNAGKSSMPPDAAQVASVDATALLFAKAMERAAEIQRGTMAEREAYLVTFDEHWRRWHTRSSAEAVMPRDDNWQDSVLRWLDAGLTIEDIVGLIPVAMRADIANDRTWRYLCGCCWNTVTDRQELARQLLEDGEV